MKTAGKKLLAAILILASLSLLSYPWISNLLFENRVDSEVKSYEKEVASEDEMEALLQQAREYNRSLSHVQVSLKDPFAGEEDNHLSYGEILPEIMCFVEIPKIDLYLPVYHGTSDQVLQRGAGHVEGSSLPVGGVDSHAVLSGHTGINSARIFTDLTEMEEGDLFFIHVLGQDLAYRVCRILVIEPENTEHLKIEEGKDLVTLLTCTPYGVNTHRLLVTGEQVPYSEEMLQQAEMEKKGTSSLWLDSYRKAMAMGGGLSLILFFFIRLLRKARYFHNCRKAGI